MRLGILGGTFDPIHFGHLFIAEEARVRFALEKVLFIPNGEPPHKQYHGQASPMHRHAMTLLATADNRHFATLDLETERPGPSYTVETLTLLRERDRHVELFYITGVDAISELLTWKDHAEVIRLATFIAATRPGFDMQELNLRLPPAYLQHILTLETTALNISSTAIRQRLRDGLPVRYLTPDRVVEYLQKHRLYIDEPAEPGDRRRDCE